MNKQECENLIEAYLAWLRKGLSTEYLEEGCELTTPFLDRHNDHLQIYAIKKEGKIELTDDGYILSDLRTSGLEIKGSKKRNAILETVLNGFGVRIEDNRLVVEASKNNLGQRIHSLVQAMLTVNDMFVMAQSRVASFFLEDVRDFLDKHNVRYSPRVKLAGISGFDHTIDFLIPKSDSRPERMVKAINNPNKSMVTTCLFSFRDIWDVRGRESKAYAFLNDKDLEIRGDLIEALEAYKVTPALGSSRSKYVQDLSA